MKCKKKSKAGGGESGDTQDKQPSASESENEFQEVPQPKEAFQQAPKTVTQAPSNAQQAPEMVTQAPPDAQQAPQAETQAPSDNAQQVPQTETQAPSNAQEDEQVNYDVYNSYICPYTMQDDYGPHLYKYEVTKWMSFKENNS